MSEELDNAIQKFITPLMNELSVELVELNIRRQNRVIVIDVIVDKPQGGITLAECSLVNQKLSQGLEGKDLIEEDFTVEVSSPGLDRPLKTVKDFLRNVGKNVRFDLSEQVEEKKEHSGIIKEVMESKIIVKINKNLIAIPIITINKAVQVI